MTGIGDISRRTAVGIVATTGIGYALFGPRGATRASGDRVIVDYWEKWTGHEGAAMLALVEKFNASQDRILVRYFSTDNIDRKAMVAIAGNSPPDLLGLWSYNIPAYAESQALVDLSELAPTHGFGLEHYADAIGPLLSFRGGQWAAANTCGTVALYYDRQAFRDAGLDPDRPPQTIGELDEAADALTVRNADGSIDRAGFLHTEPGWWAWAWGYWFGGRLIDESGRASTASDANRAAYRWVQSYPERYGLAELNRIRSTFGNFASMQQSFLARKVAMLVQGPWMANVINAFAPDLDYAAAPFPMIDGLEDPAAPAGVVECDVLVIPRGARQPGAALEFLAFTQRQENVEALSRAHAKGSPLRQVSNAFLADHPNRSVRTHEAILRSPHAFSAPAVRTWPQYRDEFNSGLERIWTLTEPADDVLRTIERRAQNQLDLATRRRRQRYGPAAG